MADLDDFVMTIGENEEVPDLEASAESEIEEIKPKGKSKRAKKTRSEKSDGLAISKDFLLDLDADGLDSVPKTMDFTMARAALKARRQPTDYKTLDEKIAAKRRSIFKEKRVDGIEQRSGGDDSSDESDGSAESGDDVEDRTKRHNGSNARAELPSEQGEGSDDDDDDNSDESESSDESALESSDTESGTDEEELAKRRAYFAPEEEINTEIPESFTHMSLSRPIMKGLTALGFVQPTPVQARAIPVALLGKDICGGAVTGSGKTGAFIIPILERLLYRPKQTQVTRVVILCPTRELAIQCHNVATKLASFTDIRVCLCVGGLSLKHQELELKQRPDIVIATPGRLIDHVRNSASFTLDTIEILVMDEADRMLEDGFHDELTEIVQHCPKQRQTMLFSATMTNRVDELIKLSLRRPVRIQIDPPKTAAKRLIQEFVRIRQAREDDRGAFLVSLCKKHYRHKCIIFFRSKAAAHQMKILFGLLGMKAGELHGNLTQEQRLDSLEQFRDGHIDFLMATDLAARGLDIKGIDTVINFNMPTSYSQYLHRIGRTARAGRSGRAVTLAGEADRKVLKTAVKNSKKDQIRQRVVPPETVQKYRERLEKLAPKLQEILEEEKQERQLREAEMQLKKAENLLDHKDEIQSRPKRTWFQSEKEKRATKKQAREAYLSRGS